MGRSGAGVKEEGRDSAGVRGQSGAGSRAENGRLVRACTQAQAETAKAGRDCGNRAGGGGSRIRPSGTGRKLQEGKEACEACTWTLRPEEAPEGIIRLIFKSYHYGFAGANPWRNS